MLETDEEGQRQLEELIRYQSDPVFNEWEKGFLRNLARENPKYRELTTKQKAVVTRLIGWLRGK